MAFLIIFFWIYLNTEVATVNIVTKEQVPCCSWWSSHFKQLHKIKELPMDVSTDWKTCSAFTKQNIQDSTDTSDFITVVFFHTTVMSCEFLYVSPGFPGLIFIVFEGLKNRRWETDSRDHCDRSSWRYRIVHFVPEVCVFIFCMQVSCINRQPGCADAWRCCCLYRDSTDYLHLIKMSRVCFVV